MRKIILVLLTGYALCVTANAQLTQKEYQFLKEAQPYVAQVRGLEMINRASAGGEVPSKVESEWVPMLAALKKVDEICKKYEPLPKPKYAVNQLGESPYTICQLAADPVGTKTKGIQLGVDAMVMDTGVVGKDIKADYTDFGGSDNQIPDRFQEMVFEPQQFRQKLMAEIAAEFAKYGVEMRPNWPDLYWKEYEKMIEKTKQRINNTMTSTSFKTGTAKDPVLEKRVRAEYAKLPNASKIHILNVVFRGSAWAPGASYTYKGSDSKYDYYKVGKGTALRGGYVIAKVDGRPDCQARDFNFFRPPGGAVQIDYINIGGRFIPCP